MNANRGLFLNFIQSRSFLVYNNRFIGVFRPRNSIFQKITTYLRMGEGDMLAFELLPKKQRLIKKVQAIPSGKKFENDVQGIFEASESVFEVILT